MVTIACPCPPLPDGSPRHPSDELTLRERLGFRAAEAIRNEVSVARSELSEDDEDLAISDILAILTEGYIVAGVETWTLADDAGPIPVNRGTIRRFILDRWDIAPDVADAADAAYAEAVMLPFAAAGCDVIAAFAGDRIDISEPAFARAAPDAVLAILDLYYPDGRHLDDIATARWRLQVLAELGYGRVAAQYVATENARLSKLRTRVR